MFQKMLIDGKLVGKDAKGKTIKVINPADAKKFAKVPKGTKKDINKAVAAAKKAFPAWAAMPLKKRQAIVSKMADVVADNAEMLARLMTKEQGKPLPEAMGEMAWAEGYLRHYATLQPKGRTIQNDDEFKIEVRRVPLGVVAGICPWNFPVLVPFWKIGPALIAGNTIVIKPAPTTPLTILKILEMCNEFVPAGVINAVTDENDLGPVLTNHPDVAKVSFTGSSETGKKIMESSAGTIKRVTLELGGNDPAIVLPDVNVKETAEKIFGGAFLNAGQVCLAVKRVYAHKDIYDEFCDELAKLAKDTIVDDGLKQGATMGPLQNEAQFKKVKALIKSAKKDGEVLSGGVVKGKKGYFVKPVIVKNVKDGDDIVDKEQFGPVLPVIKFSDIKKVAKQANASDYGLGGSVWSKNTAKATRIASTIQSGSVWVNQHINIGPHIPMAGFKASGLGVEQSDEGLEEYTQIQVMNVAK
ncbi:aldehyde dehydrogenase family protein [Sulfitobacter sp. JB4-11]|uniref:aldehyde dehydrogenase family protein n=1 Tax=Sulfitobacter rhodophyticola TaxID=3238304 RepID=UPI0035152A7B